MRALSSTYLWSRVSHAALVAAVTAIPTLLLAQQQQPASISGRVTAQGTDEPLPDVRVFLVGSALNVATNAEGRYTLRGVPTGTFEVRVIRVGYQEQKKSIAITAGAQATLDFSMKQAVVQLQEIVTTATGQQRRSEIGNTIATLGDISKRVEETPVTDIGSLIVGKAPGVIVLPGTMT